MFFKKIIVYLIIIKFFKPYIIIISMVLLIFI
nr:MAG TPA: hypothetical protein [Caudoviricetes sp.]